MNTFVFISGNSICIDVAILLRNGIGIGIANAIIKKYCQYFFSIVNSPG